MSGIPVAVEHDPNSISWGQMVSSKIESSLPPFTNDLNAKDGVWQQGLLCFLFTT